MDGTAAVDAPAVADALAHVPGGARAAEPVRLLQARLAARVAQKDRPKKPKKPARPKR
jgi:hypothetical protein